MWHDWPRPLCSSCRNMQPLRFPDGVVLSHSIIILSYRMCYWLRCRWVVLRLITIINSYTLHRICTTRLLARDIRLHTVGSVSNLPPSVTGGNAILLGAPVCNELITKLCSAKTLKVPAHDRWSSSRQCPVFWIGNAHRSWSDADTSIRIVVFVGGDVVQFGRWVARQNLFIGIGA